MSIFICVEGISQAEMLAFLFYAKATSHKLCLHKFMTTARERAKFAKRASHRLHKDNESCKCIYVIYGDCLSRKKLTFK